MIRYREYTITYDDPGVTIRRELPKGYGPSIVYKKQFTSLYDGLVYLTERIAVTDGGDLHAVAASLKNLRLDMLSLIKKMNVNSDKEKVPVSIVSTVPDDPSFPVGNTGIHKKIIKKIAV